MYFCPINTCTDYCHNIYISTSKSLNAVVVMESYKYMSQSSGAALSHNSSHS